jgi:hypothetical protein
MYITIGGDIYEDDDMIEDKYNSVYDCDPDEYIYEPDEYDELSIAIENRLNIRSSFIPR